MSVNVETDVHCKLCGNSQRFPTWSSINATKDPELRTQLLKGELTRFVCQRCGWTGDVLYPLLYHDMSKHFMVWLWPQPGEPDAASAPIDKLAPDYQLRLVDTRNDLVEKILIFEHHMDDRVVEAIKLRLWAQAMEQGKPYEGLLLFSKAAKDAKSEETMQFRHVKESETESLSVPFEFYHQTQKSLGSKLQPAEGEKIQWARIDKDYAKTLAL